MGEQRVHVQVGAAVLAGLVDEVVQVGVVVVAPDRFDLFDDIDSHDTSFQSRTAATSAAIASRFSAGVPGPLVIGLPTTMKSAPFSNASVGVVKRD